MDGENWTCTTETVSVQDGAGGNGGFLYFFDGSGLKYNVYGNIKGSGNGSFIGHSICN